MTTSETAVDQSPAPVIQHSSPCTRRGTPCAASWSPEWIAQVEAVEDLLDRRICGARTPTGRPCRMQPNENLFSFASPVVDARPCEQHHERHSDDNVYSSASPLVPASDSSHSSCSVLSTQSSALPSSCSALSTQHSALGNGRCNFHGGADLAGGQFGNQNAASHGLYTRGLRPCSPSCPLWDKCPLACQDIADLQPPERPTCPYETHDYEKAVDAYTQMLTPEDENERKRSSTSPWPPSKGEKCLPRCCSQGLASTAGDANESKLSLHLIELIHRVATLSVMVNRAAAAMREADVIDQTRIQSAGYNATYARPHAYLQAYLRLSSEFRRYQAMLKEYTPKKVERQKGEYRSISELMAELKEEYEEEERKFGTSAPSAQTKPLDPPISSAPFTPPVPPDLSDPSDPPDPSDPSNPADPFDPTDPSDPIQASQSFQEDPSATAPGPDRAPPPPAPPPPSPTPRYTSKSQKSDDWPESLIAAHCGDLPFLKYR